MRLTYSTTGGITQIRSVLITLLWKTLENYRKRWKTMEKDGKRWKTMNNNDRRGKMMKNDGKQ